jgi:hypothetical protein
VDQATKLGRRQTVQPQYRNMRFVFPAVGTVRAPRGDEEG